MGGVGGGGLMMKGEIFSYGESQSPQVDKDATCEGDAAKGQGLSAEAIL